MSDQTLFSKIIAGEIPSHRVASGDNWYAFLDIFPRRQGHTLVVPHKQVTNLSGLNDAEIAGLFAGVKKCRANSQQCSARQISPSVSMMGH